MSEWILAPSLYELKKQVDGMWPARDHSSDGTIGDTAHSQRKSDHNPNSHGVVTAIDIDADLSPTENVGILASMLQGSADNRRRLKYLIWNSHITKKGDLQVWTPYHGANAHKHHLHVSVSADPALYNDDSPWSLSLPPDTQAPSPQGRDLKFGMIGLDVKRLQQMLITARVDGVFGPKTEEAVKAFQRAHGLKADGIVGINTRKELGL